LGKFLEPIIKAQIKAIRAQIGKQLNIKNNSDIDHETASKLIDQKSALLIKPKPPAVEGNTRDQSGQDREDKANNEKDIEKSKSEESVRKSNKAPNCRFQTASMGTAGLIYDSYLEGKTVVITWNIDHPFYNKFIVEQKEDKGLVAAVDYLIYSIAAAELSVYDDEKAEIFNHVRSVTSSNMRTLLT
jgi:hypothetical protein